MDFREQQTGSSSSVALVIIAVVLQAGLSPQVSVGGGTFNFMIIVAALFAFRGEASKAVIAGFLSGLFFDLTSSTPVGLMSLLLTIGSFALVHSAPVQGGASNSAQVLTLFVFSLVLNIVFGLILLVMGIQTDIFVALFGHGLMTSILTALVSYPFVALFGAPAPAYGFSNKGSGVRFKSNNKLLK